MVICFYTGRFIARYLLSAKIIYNEYSTYVRILQVNFMSKIFVKVNADHSPDGVITPISLTWTDGRVFEIDKIKDVRMAPSLKGGVLRYTCRIFNKEFYLFCDEGKWFVER